MNQSLYYVPRISIDDPNRNIFDIHCKYEHEEKPDNLKTALINEKETSSDQSGPTIFDILMSHFQDSKSAVVIYLKVILNTVRP